MSPDQLKGILRDALKRIQSMGEEEAKSGRTLHFPSPATFAMNLSKELQADVLKSIGRAQANAGDLPGARSAWQSALVAAAEISAIGGSADRAGAYLGIAKAQFEAGEQNEARLSLRQAFQSAMSAPTSFPFAVEAFPQMGSRLNPLSAKAIVLRRIAQTQVEAGETTAARDTFRLAVETALTIGEPLNRIHALTEIAQAGQVEGTNAVWARAWDLALAMKDEYRRGKAVEMVLRARLNAASVDEVLAMVVERLKGDLQNYALWVVADAVATSEKSVASEAMARFSQIASKAKFDRPSKKLIVFQRIAEAQVRLGDYDGAYRTAGVPPPVNHVQTAHATRMRIRVMVAVAKSQLKAKHRDAAKDTALAALEMVGPLPDENADSYFPLAELGSIQARAGDVTGALHTVESLSTTSAKVKILEEVAVAYAGAGRSEDARKSIRLAVDAARNSHDEMLWKLTNLPSADKSPEGVDPILFDSPHTLAQTQARIGEFDAALEMLREVSANDYGRLFLYDPIEQIVAMRLDVSDIPGALRAVDVLPEPEAVFTSEKANLLEQVAKRQAETGDPSSVLEWVGQQKAPNTKLKMLRGLADGIAQRFVPKDSKPADATPSTKPAK